MLALFPEIWTALTGQEVEGSHFHRHYAGFGALWSVFILAYMTGRGWVERLLSTSALRFVGVVSFSVYLLHLPVIALVKHNLTVAAPLQGALAIAGSLGVSAATYLLIERPFLNLGRG